VLLHGASSGVTAGDATVTHAAGGDEAAFVLLYRHLHPRMLRYATTLVGSDAEDVVAEAWLHVARDIGRFEGGLDAFRGWVSTITRHRAMDHLRGQARRPVVLDDLAGVHEAAPDDPADEAIERLQTARAVAMVAALPTDQAEAVMLRAVVGLDVATTAEVLGKRPNAVRVNAHRGLKRLAAQLRENPDPEPDLGEARR
jgi:RNA polymerase sigma-70 factor (ECF subfamily)